MKLKTEQEIESLGYKIQGHPVTNHAFTQGYMQAQQDLLASASESFEEWVYKYPDKCDLREFEKPNHNYFVAKEGWQASKLSQAKEIEELKKENEELKRTVEKINDDFWFMINLIERYSTDKDDALKDVLERMKFRKPMLEKWFKGEKK